MHTYVFLLAVWRVPRRSVGVADRSAAEDAHRNLDRSGAAPPWTQGGPSPPAVMGDRPTLENVSRRRAPVARRCRLAAGLSLRAPACYKRAGAAMKSRRRTPSAGPHATQHRSHSHHPCRQPDPAARAAGVPARPAEGRRLRPGRLRPLPDRLGRGRRAPAGRGRHRRGQRRRVRQVDQLVAICARTAERFRAPAVQAGRQHVPARRRPREICRVLRRARRPRGRRDHAWIRSASGRSATPDRRSSSATSTTSRRR